MASSSTGFPSYGAATATQAGLVSTTTQTFGGLKTFITSGGYAFGGGSDAFTSISVVGRSISTGCSFRMFRQATEHWSMILENGGPGGNDGFAIYNAVNSIYTAGCSPTGAWTFPINTTHTFGNTSASAGTVLSVLAGGTAYDAQIFLTPGSSGDAYFVNRKVGRTTYFNVSSSTAGDKVAMAILSTGEVRIPFCYSDTTASAANVYVDSAGGLHRSTSSLAYKKDLNYEDTPGLSFILATRPFSYTPVNGEGRYLGMGAEDIQKLEPRLVSRNLDGLPDGLHYANFTVPLINAIKEQQAMIDELRAEIQALKGGL